MIMIIFKQLVFVSFLYLLEIKLAYFQEDITNLPSSSSWCYSVTIHPFPVATSMLVYHLSTLLEQLTALVLLCSSRITYKHFVLQPEHLAFPPLCWLLLHLSLSLSPFRADLFTFTCLLSSRSFCT